MQAFKALIFAGLAGLPLAAMPAMAQSAPGGVAGSTGKTDQAATAEAKDNADDGRARVCLARPVWDSVKPLEMALKAAARSKTI